MQARIAYVADQRCPSRKANAEQLVNTVAGLASEGLSVDLIIPRSWRSLGKSKAHRYEQLLDFYRVPNGFGLTELLHFPSWSLSVDRLTHGLLAPAYAALSSYDIIYTRNWVAAYAALALRKQLLFETYRVHSPSRMDPVTRLARRTTSMNFVGLFAHSEPSRQSLLRVGADASKTAVIPNGYNPDVFEPRLTPAEARQAVGWPAGEKIVCYAGRIDVEKGANSLLDLAEATPELKYVFIGYSQDRRDDWILEASAQRRLPNVRWYPWVKLADLSRYLYAANALVIPPTRQPLVKYGRTVLPLKTFLYMAAGRPIVAPRLPDIASVLTDQNAALVEPDDLEGTVRTLRRLFESVSWSESLARQAEVDSRAYTWRNRARAIVAYLNERLGAGGTRSLRPSSRNAFDVKAAARTDTPDEISDGKRRSAAV